MKHTSDKEVDAGVAQLQSGGGNGRDNHQEFRPTRSARGLQVGIKKLHDTRLVIGPRADKDGTRWIRALDDTSFWLVALG